MVDDIVINKRETIERCLHRIDEVYANDPENLMDYTKQDSIILNIQRACETSIDLAMHVVAVEKLGIPQSSRDAFDILLRHGRLPDQIVTSMKKMVGFRNIAVHDYQRIQLDILQAIIVHHLEDFRRFLNALK